MIFLLTTPLTFCSVKEIDFHKSQYDNKSNESTTVLHFDVYLQEVHDPIFIRYNI